MNLNQLFESLSADQRRVGQLPANFRAPNTSPQLSGPYPGQNATRGYLVGEQDEANSKPFKKTMVKPEEAYQRLAGGDPKAFAIDVLMPDQSAVKRLQAEIGSRAKIRGDDSIAGDGMGIQIVTAVFPDGRAAQQAFEMLMDLIRTHGGEFNQSTGVVIATPTAQGMAEAMKPSDIPPSMRDRLTMRDIEAERPQGAFRFRVTFPDGATADFMDFEAAQERAAADRGRITRLNVPAAESLRDREYHVATVTLDDGTVKKVRITTDEGFRDKIKQHFHKQGRQVQDIDVDYSVRSELDEEKPRFVNAPPRPQPSPTAAAKTLPPAPGRPSMVGGPRDRQRDLAQDLARRMAAEDVLGDVQRRLGDVIQQRQHRAEKLPQRQSPQDVLGDPVRKIDLGHGKIILIHGNEDDGFRIHVGQRVMPTRFATVEQAEMMTRVYEARMAEKKEPRLRKTARSSRIMQQLRAQYPEAQTDLEALLYDFRRGQTLDRRDINRLDSEIDSEEVQIDQLQNQLDRLKKQRDTAADLDEAKRDACYNKVRSRYKVWPSAYASGALVQCRKKGAANWGKGSKD